MDDPGARAALAREGPTFCGTSVQQIGREELIQVGTLLLAHRRCRRITAPYLGDDVRAVPAHLDHDVLPQELKTPERMSRLFIEESRAARHERAEYSTTWKAARMFWEAAARRPAASTRHPLRPDLPPPRSRDPDPRGKGAHAQQAFSWKSESASIVQMSGYGRD